MSTFAMLAAAERAPVVWGPFLSRPGEPVVRAELYRRADLTTPVAALADAWGRRWMDQLNEPGSGSLVLQNDDPDLSLVGEDDVIRFTLRGWAAFAMLVREQGRVSLAENEEFAEATTLSGPGLLAVLDEAVVYPSRGVGVAPFAEDRLFSWPSPEYDDSPWTSAFAVARQGDTSRYWTGLPPDWPDANAAWIWAQMPGEPDAQEWAPAGTCYFRTTFTVPPELAGQFIYYVTFDGAGELYIDGQLLETGTYGIEPDVSVYSNTIPISAGPHTLAARCENDVDPEGDKIHNPGGLLFSGYAADVAGRWLSTSPLVHSDNSWRMLPYPPTAPGMTPGQALRIVIAEAQARGALGPVECRFTDVVDSDGRAWPIVGDISTRIGTDVLTFVRELCATYLDAWMEPAAFVLHAYNTDGRGEDRPVTFHAPTEPDDPASGNLGALNHRFVV